MTNTVATDTTPKSTHTTSGPGTSTLHVLIHPEHLPLLKLSLSDTDQLVLGGQALAIDSAALNDPSWPELNIFGLTRDSIEWGIPLQSCFKPLSDDAWVELSAQANRVIVW